MLECSVTLGWRRPWAAATSRFLMPSRFSNVFPLLFVVLWSTGFIGARLGLPHTEPLTFLFVRYAAVVLITDCP